MKLKILQLFLETDKEIKESATQLRGYLGRRFKGFSELHHHILTEKGPKLLYSYPKIQYKIKRNKAIILGIGEECIATLRYIAMNVNDLSLDSNEYKIINLNADYQESSFGITDYSGLIRYRFISPWLALNEDNYKKFSEDSISQRREMLKKILIGNIISISKSLEYTVPSPLNAEVEVWPSNVSFKGIEMVGFRGIFEINFQIPNYLGIGKGVSHGFGTVKRLENF